MKTTNLKYLVKVNQILPITQEHFGQSMTLACIKLMALMLHALCVVQMVSLHKLADAMLTTVERDSNLRRLQRFFAKYVLDPDIIASMIYSLLLIRTRLVLSMDGSYQAEVQGVQYPHVIALSLTGSYRKDMLQSTEERSSDLKNVGRLKQLLEP